LGSLCLRINAPRIPRFGAGALFGAGAAAVVLRSPDGIGPGNGVPTIGAPAVPARAVIGGIGEYFWTNTERIMGWDIKNDGFGIVLSPELPALMRERLGEALFPFFAREGLSLADFDGLLLHPGGSRVLQTVEAALGLSRDQVRYSWEVLRDYGNMSSATALFVLKRALADDAHGRFMLAAFGPGFAGFFSVLEL
jgi:alkylresorcinol/alkylpyrone synthase